MCVAVPAKVIAIEGKTATVDFGEGTRKDVDITLVDARIGKYVLIHAGFAIHVIDEEAARNTLKMMEKIA